MSSKKRSRVPARKNGDTRKKRSPNHRSSSESPSINDIARWVRALCPADRVVQLFVKEFKQSGHDRSKNLVGLFDNIKELAREAHRVSGHATGVYFTLNPLRREVLPNEANRLSNARRGFSAKNEDVVRRELLLIDVDPIRSDDGSATKKEKDLAFAKLRQVLRLLNGRGWPLPIIVDSGNGFHLIYRIDLAAADKGLIRRVLKSLSSQLTDDSVKIDETVFDAVRLCKLPGTKSCKGSGTSDRPHRFSRVLKTPTKFRIVTQDQLEGLAAELDKRDVKPETAPQTTEWTLRRARAYVKKMPEAVSGEGGHSALFAVACRLVIDFDIAVEDAIPIIDEYNRRCKPPWTDAELRRKLRDADQQPGDRGRLRGAIAIVHAKPEDDGGEGEKFFGSIPDCAYYDRWIFASIPKFMDECWPLFPVFALSVWQQQRTDAVIPDVLLRQCWWGSKFPKNWKPQLRKRLGDRETVEDTRRDFRCPRRCLLHGFGRRHQHYVTKAEANHFSLEEFVVGKLKGGHRKFGFYEKHPRGSDFAKKKQQLRKSGDFLNIYWPVLVFGDSPKIGLTGPQQRLLLAIVRELTRDKKSRRKDKALVLGSDTTSSESSRHLWSPLLLPKQQYVDFGGNGRAQHKGLGYRMLNRGWMYRAGYTREMFNEDPVGCQLQFLTDLRVLSERFGLTVIAHHKKRAEWKDLDGMILWSKSGHGRELLQECRIRIYAPADYLLLWREWFSQQLGFRWIPDGSNRDAFLTDNGPAEDSDQIESASDVQAFLDEYGWTQQELATELGCSRRRIIRHLTGDSATVAFFEEVNNLVQGLPSK